VKALVCTAKRYNGHEFWTTLGVLQKNEIAFTVLSQDEIIFDEITGKRVRAHGVLSAFDPLNLKRYNALIFISGNMKDTESYWNDPNALSLVDKAKELDLVIAAICCSVPTIRNAAKGKKVAHFPLMRATDLLTRAGAIPTYLSLEIDRKLITAENQMVTQLWAECIVSVIKGQGVSLKLTPIGDLTLKLGRSRKPNPELVRLQRTWEKS